MSREGLLIDMTGKAITWVLGFLSFCTFFGYAQCAHGLHWANPVLREWHAAFLQVADENLHMLWRTFSLTRRRG